MGNHRKHIFWPLQFRNPNCTLCQRNDRDTWPHLLSTCDHPYLKGLRIARHNKAVHLITQTLQANNNTRFFTLVNAGNHNNQPPDNTIPEWILACTCAQTKWSKPTTPSDLRNMWTIHWHAKNYHQWWQVYPLYTHARGWSQGLLTFEKMHQKNTCQARDDSEQLDNLSEYKHEEWEEDFFLLARAVERNPLFCPCKIIDDWY